MDGSLYFRLNGIRLQEAWLEPASALRPLNDWFLQLSLSAPHFAIGSARVNGTSLWIKIPRWKSGGDAPRKKRRE